jgi:hypothetical protein
LIQVSGSAAAALDRSFSASALQRHDLVAGESEAGFICVRRALPISGEYALIVSPVGA